MRNINRNTHIKTTILMAISVNGFVAKKDGNEDWLPHQGWLDMISFTKKYGHLIWGRRTYEAVKNWGGNYLTDLKNIPIIIVSKSGKKYKDHNVTVCSSPYIAIQILENKGFKKAFLSGGPTLNTAFVKAGLVDEIVINYNPTILSGGIKLFNDDDFELKLRLTKLIKKKHDIIQAYYSVIDN